MNKISAKYSLKRFNELYERTLSLPEKIITDDDLNESLSQDEFKQKQYEQKKLSMLFETTKICLEIRSLIKLVYGHESEYLTWINKITFTSESNGILYDSYNTAHNNYWQTGKNELFSLISNIQFEEMERMNYENSLVDKNLLFKYFITGVLFIVFTLATWTISPDILSVVFDSSKIIAVRVCLSLIFSALIGTIVFKEHRKDLIITAILTLILSLVGLLKSQIVSPVDNKSVQQKVTKDTSQKQVPTKSTNRQHIIGKSGADVSN